MSGISGEAWSGAGHVLDKYQEGQATAEKRSQQQFLNNLEKQKHFNETARVSIDNLKLQNEIAQLDPNMVPVFQQAQSAFSQGMINDAMMSKAKDQITAEQLNQQGGQQGQINLLPGQNPDATNMAPEYNPLTMQSLPAGYKPFSKREAAQMDLMGRSRARTPEQDNEKFDKQSILQLRRQRESLAAQKAAAVSKASADPFARREVPNIISQYDSQLSELDGQLGDYQAQYPHLFPRQAPQKKAAGQKINEMINAPTKPVKAGSDVSAATANTKGDEGPGFVTRAKERIDSLRNYDSAAMLNPDLESAAPEEKPFLAYRKAFANYMAGNVKPKDMPNDSTAIKIRAVHDKVDQLVKEKKLTPEAGRRLKDEMEVYDFVNSGF